MLGSGPLETTHVRQIMIGATALLAIAAHVFVMVWLLRMFPLLARHRRAVITTAVILFLTAPVGRLFGAL